MTDYCYPCLERTGKKVAASRCIAGTWMCARCFSGRSQQNAGVQVASILAEIAKLKDMLADVRLSVREIRREMAFPHREDERKHFTALADRIIAEVETEFGIPLRLLSDPSHAAKYMPARMAISLLLREECDYSYPKISKILGRHHTTVIKQINDARACGDAAFMLSLKRVRERVRRPLTPMSFSVHSGARQWQPHSQLSQ